MPTSTVKVLFLGDAASAVRATGQLERGFGGLSRAAGTAAKLVGVGIVGGLVAATKTAIDFDRAMRNVNSISRLSEKEFQKLSNQVRGLSKETAQAPKTLAEGMYDLVSSGFKANDAIKVLRVSAKAASAGLTDTKTATKAVAAALNAYHLTADDARKVSDVLFQTVNKGVLTFEELAQNMGDLVPAAAPLGVTLEEVGAAIATITLQGVPAAEAATRVKNSMLQLASPSKALSKLLKENGFSSAEAAIQSKGYAGVLDLVNEATGGNVTKTSKLIPEIRALMGFVGLTGKNISTYKDNLKAMDQATAGAGATSRAFAEQGKSISFQWQKAKATLAAAAIPIGQLLFPALAKAAEGVGIFAETIQRNMPEIRRQFGEVSGAVQDFGRIAFSVASTDLGQAGLLGALTALTTLNVAGKMIAMKAALGGLAGPVSIAAAGVGILAGGLLYLALQGDQASESLDRLREALRAEFDATRDLEQAQLRVSQADTAVAVSRAALTRQTRLTATAIEEYGRNSEQARQMLLAQRQAEDTLKQAILNKRRALQDIPRSQQAVADTAVIANKREKQALDDTNAALLRQEGSYYRASNSAKDVAANQAKLNEVLDLYAGKLQAIDKDTGRNRGTTQQYVAAVRDLYEQLGRLPNRKQIEIAIRFRQYGRVPVGVPGLPHRASGGFIPMMPGATRGADSVPIMATPGEIVLNRPQQDALGGPRFLADLFGFRGERGPGFQAGGIVIGPGGPRRSRSSPHRPSRRRAYGKLTRETRAVLGAVEEVNQRQSNLDRRYGQLAREFDISREEFVLTDAEGNESLDQAAVAKRLSEISQLVASRQQMVALVDEEKRRLELAIDALQEAIKRLLAMIRAEQEAARADARAAAELAGQLRQVDREMQIERRRNFPAGKKGEAARRASQARIYALEDRRSALQTGITRSEKSKSAHLQRAGIYQGSLGEFQQAMGEARSNLRNGVPFDRRDVQLDIKELRAEAADIRSIRPRPGEPPIGDTMPGGGGDGGGGDVVGGIFPPDDRARLEDEIRRLLEELGRLRLAVAVEQRQLGIIGGFQKGTIHVAETGLALVHAGERIKPAGVPEPLGAGLPGAQPFVVMIEGKGDRMLEEMLREFVDVRVVRQTPEIMDRMGRRADLRARAGGF